MNILFLEAEESYYMHMDTKIPKRWAYLVEIATYVRNHGHDVKVMDCLDPKISHAEVITEVTNNHYDMICFLMRIETYTSLRKLTKILKTISPDTKFISYGDAPAMFVNTIKETLPALDAVIESGDWEVAITNYAKYISGEAFQDTDVPGITIKENGEWINAKRCNGEHFNGWEFPDLDNPIANYDLYFSITKGQLTFSVSRGCPYNCKFCLAVKTFNKDDRRKPPKEIVDYMIKNRDKVKSYKLFSPTFTYDEGWVTELCNEMITRKANVTWVCTSRPDRLKNEELLKLMVKAGCIRIAVGIETLDETSNRELNKFANIEEYKNTLRNLFDVANRIGLQIKLLLMLGIKGQTKENVNETLAFLKECGVETLRMAAYSPRQDLTEADNKSVLNVDTIEQYDKMTFINFLPDGMSERDFLNYIYKM